MTSAGEHPLGFIFPDNEVGYCAGKGEALAGGQWET